MRIRTLAIAAPLSAAALAFGASGMLSPAQAYAPASTATVHPGVQMVTVNELCTANFIFSNGTDTFIGQAAHCSSTGGSTDTNGCTTASQPLGTPVTITGASKPGTLVYNSWIAMQAAGETDADTCAYNDFALVKIDPADVAKVNPSVPHWGGPSTVNTTGTPANSKVYSYGNSPLRFGITLLSPKQGTASGDVGGGWSHVVTTITPGVPGDSGSAFLDDSGRAVGILSTLGVGVPGGVVNNISDVNHVLNYAHSHGMAGVNLVAGTEPFNYNAGAFDTNDPIGGVPGNLCNYFGLCV